MIMNNRCKTNPSKIDGDFEEKKSISDPNNINLETDLYNKEKSQPDTECGDKSVDQNFNKRTYNNLQNADTEEVLESALLMGKQELIKVKRYKLLKHTEINPMTAS